MKTPSTKFIITLSIISTLFSFSSFADGLDGEFYVNQRWRDLTAGYSPTVNPAFMIEKNQRSARLAMCYYLPDSSYLMENGMMWPVSLYGAFGVTFMGERAREYTITGDKSKHTEKMVILSFAVNPLDRLSFGHNIGILYGERFNKKYRYITFDVGASYRFLIHPIFGSHLTGISLQNALSTDLPFNHWQNQPVNLKFSWLAEFWEGRIEPGIDLNLTNIMSDGDETEININSRIGFKRYPVNTQVQIGDDYWGASAGLEFTANKSHDLKLTFQFTSAFEEKDQQSYTLYFNSDFGTQREEIYSRRMGRIVGGNPAYLCNHARALYEKEKYFDALCIFAKVIVYFPVFFKNDWVLWHIVVSFERMNMRDLSYKYLIQLKNDYKKSSIIPNADLELMRFYYTDRNNEKVQEQFELLSKRKVSDSLKYHALCIIGDTYFHDKEYNKAIEFYDTVPENHPKYLSSQFSKAIAYSLMNRTDQADEIFTNIIQHDTTDTVIDGQMKIRSHAMLFHNRLKSVTDKKQFLANSDQFFQNIPEEKLRMNVVDSSRTLIEYETILLKIKKLLNNKNYTEAESTLKELKNTIVNYKQNREMEGKKIESEYLSIREPYDELALEFEKLIFQPQTSFTIQKIDSLHIIQKEYYKTIKAYRSYQKDFKWRMLWNKTIEDLHARVKKTLAEVEVLLKEEE